MSAVRGEREEGHLCDSEISRKYELITLSIHRSQSNDTPIIHPHYSRLRKSRYNPLKDEKDEATTDRAE